MAERPERRSQGERSNAMRETLIAATLACIADLGYAETTTTRVAERAGVSRGALQHQFATRDDLLIAVIDRVMAALNFGFDPASLARQPVDARVDALLDRYRNVFGSDVFLAVLDIWLGVRSEPILLQRMRRHLRNARAAMEAIWLSAFRDAALTRADLQSLRRVVMAVGRGYAIGEIFGPKTSDWARDRVVVREFVLSYLERRMARRNQAAS